MAGFDIGSVYAKVDADISGFKKGMDQAQDIAQRTGQGIGNVAGAIKETANQASILVGVLGGALGLVGKNAISVAGDLEQTQIAFNTLLKDEQKTTEAIAQIKKDAQKSTLFGFNDLAKANQLLISAGENTEDARKNINALSDAISSTGGGSAELSRLAVNLQQIKALGKASALDIKQFAFAGINIYQLLADETGKSVEQVRELDVSYELLTKSLKRANKEGGLFAGGAEAQSKSLKGLYEGLKDTINLTLADIVVQTGLFGVIKDGLSGISDNIVPFTENVTRFFNVLSNGILLLSETAKGGDLLYETMEFVSYFMGGTMPDENHPAVRFIIALGQGIGALGKWISENQALVMTFVTGLGIGLGTLLVLGTVNMLIMAILNPMNLLVLAVAGLYTAWETNFLGIQNITKAVLDWFFNTFYPEFNNFWNNYIKPIIANLANYIKDNWDLISGTTNAMWKVISGFVQFWWSIIYNLIKAGLALFTGDWVAFWDSIAQLTDGAWQGIKKMFSGWIEFVKTWGQELGAWIRKPFEDAYEGIKGKMAEIRDAIDFTKRHSPSVIDIINRGVDQANKALGGLAMGFDMNPSLAHASSQSTNSSMVNVRIDMAGAFIGDEYSASSMAESMGDSIIKKLQSNLRI